MHASEQLNWSNREYVMMKRALSLAHHACGTTAPNPPVGCVIAQDFTVVGEGCTQPGGRPHAEAVALAQAGDRARGATAYITLEPCSHYGKSPPCADGLVKAGITKAFVAVPFDPDPRVAGRGIQRLQEAGIIVHTGLLERSARELISGFVMRVSTGRPLFTLKLATSIDGRIATKFGESKWITGPYARDSVHRLRAENDAILVGSGTVLADDPELTSRMKGVEGRPPLRIVLDSRLRIPMDSKLVTSATRSPLVLVTLNSHPESAFDQLRRHGVQVVCCSPDESGRLSIQDVPFELGKLGLTRVLIEGGGSIASAFLRAGLIDRLIWYRANIIIGGDGYPALDRLGVEQLAQAPAFRLVRRDTCGSDTLEVYVPNSDQVAPACP